MLDVVGLHPCQVIRTSIVLSGNHHDIAVIPTGPRPADRSLRHEQRGNEHALISTKGNEVTGHGFLRVSDRSIFVSVTDFFDSPVHGVQGLETSPIIQAAAPGAHQ